MCWPLKQFDNNDDIKKRPSSLLVKDWASDNWSHALKSAASVNESRTNWSCLRMFSACPVPGIASCFFHLSSFTARPVNPKELKNPRSCGAADNTLCC